MRFSIAVKEKIARVIADFFTTNQMPLDNLLVPIKTIAEGTRQVDVRFDPQKIRTNKAKTAVSGGHCPPKLRVLDDVRTIILSGKSAFSFEFAI